VGEVDFINFRCLAQGAGYQFLADANSKATGDELIEQVAFGSTKHFLGNA
jgi:hypothetical protein